MNGKSNLKKGLSLIFLFLLHQAYGQYTIKGLVSETNKTSIPYVNIICKDKAQKVVAYISSDENGSYTINVDEIGKYFVTFMSLGYKKETYPIEITELNFFSNNSKTTNETRAKTIANYILRNFKYNFDKLKIKHTIESNEPKLNGDIFLYLLFVVKKYNELYSLPMCNAKKKDKEKLIDYDNISLYVDIGVKIIKKVSKHIFQITHKKINILELLNTKYQKKFNEDFICVINEMDRTKLSIKMYHDRKEEYLLSTRKYKFILNESVAILINYWINFSIYCLKNSIFNLVLLFDYKALSSELINIMKKRNKEYFVTNLNWD